MSRFGSISWSLPCVAVAASLAGTASAEEITASLNWVRLPGAESCIPAQALARAVEDHLGKSVFVSPSVAGLIIEGRVEPKPGGFTATVHATRADGTDLGVRTLESEAECGGLDENLALVLALMIDPDAVAREREVKNAPPPAPPAPPPTPPPTVIVQKERVLVPVVQQPPEPEEPWQGEARVAATLSRGVLPGTAFGFLASGNLQPPEFWPIELTGYGWTEQQAETPDGGADFSMFAASLAACPGTHLSAALHGNVCAGLMGGALRARGFGFDHVNEGTKPVLAVMTSLRLSLDLAGPLFVSLGAGLHAAVVRPRYVVSEPNGTRDLFQMNAVGTVGEFGLGLRFQP